MLQFKNKNMRQLGGQNPFMSDFDLLLFFNISKQFLAPGGLNAECHECVQVSVMLVSCKCSS